MQLLDLHQEGQLHLIVPLDRFELLKGGGAAHDLHVQHGRREAPLLHGCGIHPFYTPRSDPDKVDVNIRCLDGDAWRRFSFTSFDGKNWEAAQAARRATDSRAAQPRTSARNSADAAR